MQDPELTERLNKIVAENEQKRAEESAYQTKLDRNANTLDQIIKEKKELQERELDQLAKQKADAEFDKAWAAYFKAQEDIGRVVEDKKNEKLDPLDKVIADLEKELKENQNKQAEINKNWGSKDWQTGLDLQANNLVTTTKTTPVFDSTTTPEQMAAVKAQFAESDEMYKQDLQKFKEKPNQDVRNNMQEELAHVLRKIREANALKEAKIPVEGFVKAAVNYYKSNEVQSFTKNVQERRGLEKLQKREQQIKTHLSDLKKLKSPHSAKEQATALKALEEETVITLKNSGAYEPDKGTKYQIAANEKNYVQIAKNTCKAIRNETGENFSAKPDNNKVAIKKDGKELFSMDKEGNITAKTSTLKSMFDSIKKFIKKAFGNVGFESNVKMGVEYQGPNIPQAPALELEQERSRTLRGPKPPGH